MKCKVFQIPDTKVIAIDSDVDTYTLQPTATMESNSHIEGLGVIQLNFHKGKIYPIELRYFRTHADDDRLLISSDTIDKRELACAVQKKFSDMHVTLEFELIQALSKIIIRDMEDPPKLFSLIYRKQFHAMAHSPYRHENIEGFGMVVNTYFSVVIGIEPKGKIFHFLHEIDVDCLHVQ